MRAAVVDVGFDFVFFEAGFAVLLFQRLRDAVGGGFDLFTGAADGGDRARRADLADAADRGGDGVVVAEISYWYWRLALEQVFGFAGFDKTKLAGELGFADGHGEAEGARFCGCRRCVCHCFCGSAGFCWGCQHARRWHCYRAGGSVGSSVGSLFAGDEAGCRHQQGYDAEVVEFIFMLHQAGMDVWIWFARVAAI